jgi:hypothetical protein
LGAGVLAHGHQGAEALGEDDFVKLSVHTSNVSLPVF